MSDKLTFAIALLFFLLGTSLEAQTIKLEKIWSVSEGFTEPESVAYDPDSGKLFVTNVNGYARNGRGYISRMDASGKNIESEWINNLNAPTGIVYYQGQLIFADFDELKVADAASGNIIASFKAPDSRPSLNDVAVAPDGSIFVSASAKSIVYRLIDDKLEPFIEDERALKNVNGLYIRDDTLITGSEYLHAWRLSDGDHLGILVDEDSPIKDIDGIAGDKLGNLIVSVIDDDRFWVIKPGGAYTAINRSNINPVDFHLHPNLEFLFTATIDTRIRNYGVSAFRYMINK